MEAEGPQGLLASGGGVGETPQRQLTHALLAAEWHALGMRSWYALGCSQSWSSTTPGHNAQAAGWKS